MRATLMILGIALVSATSTQALAKPTPQSAYCTASAKEQKLTGGRRTTFLRTCMKGPLTPARPTAPTGSSQEAQAVTKPSGVDRTTRAKQCASEADRKGLAANDRKAFQLSCQATAGPVTEGETATKSPEPAKAIKGIGVNNYKPAAPPAKSEPVRP